MRREGGWFSPLRIRRKVLRETPICLATARSPNSPTSDPPPQSIWVWHPRSQAIRQLGVAGPRELKFSGRFAEHKVAGCPVSERESSAPAHPVVVARRDNNPFPAVGAKNWNRNRRRCIQGIVA